MRKTLALFSLLLVSGGGAVTVAAADDIPRTASGKPDFTGRYDIRTLTPFERRPVRGEQLVLSAEDVARVESAEAAKVIAGDAASRPDRSPPEKGAFIDSQSYNYAWTRVIRIDADHVASDIRSYSGDSIGWWDGDTLVVERRTSRSYRTFRGKA